MTTIPLARQQGAGPQFGSGPIEVEHNAVNPFRRPRLDPVKQTPSLCLQFAEPIGLQPIGQNTKQQVAGQVRGARRLNTVCHLARSSPTSRPRRRAISLFSASPSGTAGSITTRAMAFKLRDGAKGGTQNGQRRRG